MKNWIKTIIISIVLCVITPFVIITMLSMITASQWGNGELGFFGKVFVDLLSWPIFIIDKLEIKISARFAFILGWSIISFPFWFTVFYIKLFLNKPRKSQRVSVRWGGPWG